MQRQRAPHGDPARTGQNRTLSAASGHLQRGVQERRAAMEETLAAEQTRRYLKSMTELGFTPEEAEEELRLLLRREGE